MANHSPKFLEVVHKGLKEVPEVSVADTQKRLDRGDDILLIDCREESEWAAGHLPGATHLGKGIIERDIEALEPSVDREIIIYCGGGYRSVLAAQSLKNMGYRQVKSMAGGWKGWLEAGHKTEKPS